VTGAEPVETIAERGASSVDLGATPARRTGTAAYIFLVAGSVGIISLLSPTVITFVASVAAVLLAGRLTGRGLVDSAGGVVVAITGLLFRADFSGLPAWSLIVGLVAAALCFVPLASWRRRPDRFPLLGIFCAIQGVYIYVGALLGQPSLPYQATYSLHVREVGLVASLAYVAVLVTTGLLVLRLPVVLPRIRRWTSTVSRPVEPSASFRRATLLVIIGIAAARFVPASVAGHLGAIPQIVGLARVAGAALMAVLWLRRQLSPAQKAVTVSAIAIDMLAGTTGQFLLFEAATCAIACLFVLTLSRPHLAVWLFILLVPFSLLFNVAKTEARATEAPTVGHIAAATILVTDALRTAQHPNAATLSNSADRFSNSDLLGYMAIHVPRDYPYWNKQSYIDFPLVLLPRVLVPFKPADTLANEFGRRYGLASPNDFVTSANTPVQVEAWANFGAPGLVGIAIFLGFLLAVAEGWFDPTRTDGFILGIMMAYASFGFVESGINAIALAIPTVLIYAPILRWTLKPKWNAETAPRPARPDAQH